MTVIILISFISYILYKIGYATKLLNNFILEEIPLPQNKPNNTVSMSREISEREQLEIQARYIVKKMGDDPRTVKYMGDDLLRALIKDFIKESEK